MMSGPESLAVALNLLNTLTYRIRCEIWLF